MPGSGIETAYGAASDDELVVFQVCEREDGADSMVGIASLAPVKLESFAHEWPRAGGQHAKTAAIGAAVLLMVACGDDLASNEPILEHAGIVNRIGIRYSAGCARTELDELACWDDPTDMWNTKEPGFQQSPATILAHDVRGVTASVASCAVFEGGIKCWGPNNDNGVHGYGDVVARGEIHAPVPDVDELPFVDLGDTADVRLFISADAACAVFEDGRMKCWGFNASGGLGLGDTENRGDEPGEMGDALPYVDLGADARVVDVDTFQGTTCAALDDGRLKCWGWNGDGELGLGDRESRGDEPGEMGDALPEVALGAGERAVDVGVGEKHVCAAFESGGLKCWGRNHELDPNDVEQIPLYAGRLGYGDTVHRGLTHDEMGDALPYVDVGTGLRVVSVDAGYWHTCALLHTGQVKCWGAEHGDALDISRIFGLYGNLGDEPGEMGDALPAYDFGGRRAVALAVDGTSNCAVLEDGAIHCWGGSHEIDWPILLP